MGLNSFVQFFQAFLLYAGGSIKQLFAPSHCNSLWKQIHRTQRYCLAEALTGFSLYSLQLGQRHLKLTVTHSQVQCDCTRPRTNQSKLSKPTNQRRALIWINCHDFHPHFSTFWDLREKVIKIPAVKQLAATLHFKHSYIKCQLLPWRSLVAVMALFTKDACRHMLSHKESNTNYVSFIQSN